MSTPPGFTGAGPNPVGTQAPAQQQMSPAQLGAMVGALANGAMATAGGTTTGKLTDNSQIFTGWSVSRNRAAADGKAAPGQVKTPVYQTYAQAKQAPLSWSDEQLAQFVNKGMMAKAKGFDVNMGMPDIMSTWDDLLKSAYGFNQADPSHPKWTASDILDTYANPKGKFGEVQKGDWMYDIATGEKTKYVGPLQKTTTATTINELNRQDALALTKQSMSQLLGRAPTNDEVTQYMNLLNGYERANPDIATTTENIDPTTGQATSSTTTRQGSARMGPTAPGRQALLESQLQKTPEYGAYQAATTGMSWLMAAINGAR